MSMFRCAGVLRTMRAVWLVQQKQPCLQAQISPCLQAAVFAAVGHQIPFGYNPSDFIMDLLVMKKLDDRQSTLLIQTARQGAVGAKPHHISKQLTKRVPQEYEASFCEQMSVLTGRTFQLEKHAITATENMVMYIGTTFITGIFWSPQVGDARAHTHSRTHRMHAAFGVHRGATA